MTYTLYLVATLLLGLVLGYLGRIAVVEILWPSKESKYQVIDGKRILYSGKDLRKAKGIRAGNRMSGGGASLWKDGVNRG
jgi:hypothetical protein